MRILVTDDDEIIGDSSGLFFRKNGWYMLAVENAEQLSDALKKERFDIIVADYRLLGMDGLEFLRLASRSFQKTMNILLTTHGCDDITAETLEEGVHDFIQKPFSPETLIASLELLLKNGEEKTQH